MKPTRVPSRNEKDKSKNNCVKEKSETRNSNSKAKTTNKKSIQLGTPKGEVTIMKPTQVPSRNEKDKGKNKCVEEKSETRNSNSKANTANKKIIQLGTSKGEGDAKSKASEAPLQSKTTNASKKASLTSTKELPKGTISLDVGKNKGKATLQQPINRNPNYYIRFKGFEETKLHWNCALCEKNLIGVEDGKQEYELEFSLFPRHQPEEESVSLLPEVAVLPCTHVFHTTCLSASHPANITDPSCPICLSLQKF